MTREVDKDPPSLSVVVPAFDEGAPLAAVVEKPPRLLEVIVVDAASSDSTPEVARGLAAADARVRVARHARVRGKTEALRTGFALTRGEIVIVQDADLEYDPAEIPLVILPIR